MWCLLFPTLLREVARFADFRSEIRPVIVSFASFVVALSLVVLSCSNICNKEDLTDLRRLLAPSSYLALILSVRSSLEEGSSFMIN